MITKHYFQPETFIFSGPPFIIALLSLKISFYIFHYLLALAIIFCLYFSFTWRGIEINPIKKIFRHFKSRVGFKTGNWIDFKDIQQVYVTPESHKNSGHSRSQSINFNTTTFNIQIHLKSGDKFEIEKHRSLVEAMKSGNKLAKELSTKYDMWKWPKRKQKA